MNVSVYRCLSVFLVTSIWPLIGQKGDILEGSLTLRANDLVKYPPFG